MRVKSPPPRLPSLLTSTAWAAALPRGRTRLTSSLTWIWRVDRGQQHSPPSSSSNSSSPFPHSLPHSLILAPSPLTATFSSWTGAPAQESAPEGAAGLVVRDTPSEQETGQEQEEEKEVEKPRRPANMVTSWGKAATKVG